MSVTRREFSRLALAGVPAALVGGKAFGSVFAQAKPNSLFKGVQVGVITYSYRSMPDQSLEATLGYIVNSGISAVELMDGPLEQFLGRPAANRGGGPGGAAFAGGPGGARPGGPGAPGAPGAAAAPAGPTPYEQLMSGTMPQCTPGQGRQGGGGGGRGGRGAATPEQIAAQQAAADDLRKWRTSVSLAKVAQAKKLLNDAGVTVYAYKPDGLQKNMQTTDAEFDYVFSIASGLGASHLTMELPAGDEADAMLKRLAGFAQKHKVYVGYHTHGQGSMTAFDRAMEISDWNRINVDLGHYVAAGNVGGGPLQFLEKHHAKIVSFHLKDRTLPEHCALTTPFGRGDGQIKDILLLMAKNKWRFPATIELEYAVPAGSDAVKEVKNSVEYARTVLA